MLAGTTFSACPVREPAARQRQSTLSLTFCVITAAMRDLLERCLTPGCAEDDLVLVATEVVAAAALDARAAEPMAETRLIPLLAGAL